MSSVTAAIGDTFESISKATYGTSEKAALIKSANPGAGDSPTPGATIIIPKRTPSPAPRGVPQDTIAVLVDGVKFVGWTELAFTQQMDSFGSFSFLSVWEPSNSELREIFKPLSFKSIEIFDGPELLFSGTMMTVDPSLDPTSRTLVAGGYGVPGVLNDCTPPGSALPLERDATNLKQIAIALAAPFGINVEMELDPGPAFIREAIDPAEDIYPYLIELAKQRNFIIGATPGGNLQIQREIAVGSPVAVIKQEDTATLSVVPQFNPQEFYSHITGQGRTTLAAFATLPGNQYTKLNPALDGILRPFSWRPPDVLAGDLPAAVEAKAARMYAGAVSYQVTFPTWKDGNGVRWAANTTIKLQSEGAMIYSLYEFLIRKVEFHKMKNSETATLHLVLPGVFSGVVPTVLPWD